MQKKRGLKRHYRNLSNTDFVDNLDFSDSKDSWFDYYHIHIDNTGLGNRSLKSRLQHLDALFLVAKKIENNLESYSKEYQYWIEIHEDDSFDDSIYIHTKNRNGSEFPAKLEFDEQAKITKPELWKYISSKDYIIRKKILLDENENIITTYFLQKDKLGIKF